MKIPKSIQNLFFSTANVYTEYFLGLIVSIVIARSLGPDQFGIYSLFVWICALSIVVVNGGVGIGAIKFFSELVGRGDQGQIDPLHNHLSYIQNAKAAVFAGVFALVCVAFADSILGAENAGLLWLAIPAVAFKSYYMYQIGVVKGLQEFRYLALTAVVVAPANVVLVSAVYVLSPSIEAYVLVYVLNCILYWLASAVGRVRSVKRHAPSGGATRLPDSFRSRVNLHLKTVGVLAILWFIVIGQSELAFLKWLATPSDIAYFSVGFVLVRAATALVPGVYNNLLLAHISRKTAEVSSSDSEAVINSTYYMLFLGALIGMPLALFAEDVVVFLYGDDYQPAAMALRVFALVAIVSGVRNAANAYLMSTDRLRLLTIAIVIAVLSVVVLDYFLISAYGFGGAVVAFASIDLATAVGLAICTYRILGTWPELRRVIRLFVSGLLSAAATYWLSVVFSFPMDFLFYGPLCAAVFAIAVIRTGYIIPEHHRAFQSMFESSTLAIVRISGRLLFGRHSPASADARGVF